MGFGVVRDISLISYVFLRNITYVLYVCIILFLYHVFLWISFFSLLCGILSNFEVVTVVLVVCMTNEM